MCPLRIEADDPGGDPGEHRLGEASAVVELQVGVLQRLLLTVDLAGHAIEGTAERADLVVAPGLGDTRRELAGPDPVGGGDEPADRPGDPVGELEAEPDRRQQHQECHHNEDHHEGDLDAVALLFEPLVVPHHRLNLPRVRDHLRLQGARDVEVGVDEAGQLDQRAHTVADARQNHEAALRRRIHGPLGQGLDLEPEAALVAADDIPVAVENDHFGERERVGGFVQDSGQQLRIAHELHGVAVDPQGRGQGADANAVALLVHIGLGHDQRTVERARDLLAEPGLHAEVEEERREHGDDDRRRHRDNAEQPGHARVQPRPGRPAAALDPKPYQP